MELIDVPVPALFRTRRGAPLSFGIVETKVRRVEMDEAPKAVASAFLPVGYVAPIRQWHRSWGGGLWSPGHGGMRAILPSEVGRRGGIEWIAIARDVLRSHWIGAHPFQHLEPDRGISPKDGPMPIFREDASESAVFREIAEAVKARAQEALVVGNELWRASLGPVLSVEIGTMMKPERVGMTTVLEGAGRHVLPSERRYSSFDMEDLEHVYRGQGLQVLRRSEMPEIRSDGGWSVEDVSRRAFAAEVVVAAWGVLLDSKDIRPSALEDDAVIGMVELRDRFAGLLEAGRVRPLRWGAKEVRVSTDLGMVDVRGLVDALRVVADGTSPMLPAYRIGWQAFLEEADRRLGRSVDAGLLGAML